MLTQASNSHTLSPAKTSHDGLTVNKIPVITTHHDPLESLQLDKQGRTDAPYVQDLYETVLPWWRAAIRARILSSVKQESRILARMQECIRHPWLDAYFLYSSSLGTHTFFMIGLPLLFFFGYEEIGRGLVIVLASGVYVSSFVKDLICSPRPLAPPVTRLTIGTHHLEYGFPSTHSTNSVSMALFIFGYVRNAYIQSATISSSMYYASCAMLVIYATTIVFGRLYTGMHSFTDCAVGVFLGAIISGAYVILKETIENWLASARWIVPLTVIPICLLLVHYHPQPVDDCPCFEDAIAFVSVILGIALCRWHIVYSGVDERFLGSVMPNPQGIVWTWKDTVSWWTLACAKVTVGILVIFVWRLLAKSLLHLTLPPLFRLLASSFDLPHRRFYTPATDYQHMPVESSLRPIPSMIDLPGVLEVSGMRERSGLGRTSGTNEVKRRGAKSNNGSSLANGDPGAYSGSELENSNGPFQRKEVKHYDADVLTKVVVYAGIAILAGEGLPVTFAILGWGVKPW
ncbi:PAP2 superfamily-domain-containing protein [Suillus paluster]|uniref:PAP2 superfamily-domain-containing protein n=1 Tax=Suillus paluster TaxID=48578 RepID=UPI001B88211E|nr:PAP2 superfamily-domain-containing protein [Suillus paluster]KAG1731080.1 PAP2 superfamily-domain-containing protein [Suillus paluster]